ncbi:MAG: S8 family serine peptidase [Bacteroidota bacterium]
MAQLKVKSGENELLLRQSTQLVGIKSTTEKDLNEAEYVSNKVHENLGGFQVVELDQQVKTVDDRLDEVRTLEEVEVGTHVFFAQGSDVPFVPTGEIYITFEPNVSPEEQQIVLDEFKLELVEQRGEDEMVAKVTKHSKNPIKVAAAMQALSMVVAAEPDLDSPVEEYDFVAPRDELLPHQWHLKNNGRIADVSHISLKPGADAKVVEAWDLLGNMGSSRITVAVIDNGFDLNHPDLRHKVTRPWDLWRNSSRISTGDTRFTHGTPCASVAVAASNGVGMVGSAPNAKFMPISGTSFANSTTEKMFDYCVRNGADIISCSWGSTDQVRRLNSHKTKAISRAATQGRGGKGCIILYAAGNDGFNYINWYAAHPDVIAVGACTSQDRYATYSNRGPELDVVAPSNGHWPILAARASWDQGHTWQQGEKRYYIDGKSRGSKYKHFGGTSSATPLVAGICALILSANPNLTAKQVKQILRSTADKIGSPSEYINGHSKRYGYGRVNAYQAVKEALRMRSGGSSSTTTRPPTTTRPSTGGGSIPLPPIGGNTGGGSTTTRPTTPTPSPTPRPPVTPSPSPRPSTPVNSNGTGLFHFSVKSHPKNGWGVQIGVFADYANVLVQAERLERQFNQKILVNIAKSGSRTTYKVVVGALPDVGSARNLLTQLQRAGVNGFLRRLQDL